MTRSIPGDEPTWAVPRIERATDDDPAFIAGVERIVAGSLGRFRSELACFIRIHGWFAHRWLDGSADRLAFPPFVRTRIAEERHWARRDDGTYAPTPVVTPVHRVRPQRRPDDQRRRALAFTRSGLFVWYSSGSLRSRRGSVMSYVVDDGRALPWFASLVPGDHAWRAHIVKGLGIDEVRELMTHPLAMTC